MTEKYHAWKLREQRIEKADKNEANIDYNIMMGNLEAPEEVTENE